MKALMDKTSTLSKPGPGAYDPRVTEKGGGLEINAISSETFNASAKKGTIAFGVQSKARMQHETGNVPSAWAGNSSMTDPGAYDPNHNREIAHHAKKTFQKSSAAGQGAFGGKGQRNLKLSNGLTHQPASAKNDGFLIDQEATPGADAYTPLVTETGGEANMNVMNAGEKMKSAAFASTSKRPTLALPNRNVPGPGAYENINPDSIQANLETKPTFLVGRDVKYTGDFIDGGGEDCTTDVHIGPGTYTAVRNKSGNHDTFTDGSAAIVDRSQRYKKSLESKSEPLAFESSGPQRVLPFEAHRGVASKAEATPEPGKYDPRVTEKGGSLAINAISSETFNASAKKGTVAFGVQSKARMQHETGNVPSAWAGNSSMTDPGAYDPNHNREIAHHAKKTFQKSSAAGQGAFGGKGQRNLKLSNGLTHQPASAKNDGFLIDQEATPGADAYTPLVTETGGEANMNVMNAGEKMKSAAFASTSKRPTLALPNRNVPGPGAYENINPDSIQANLETKPTFLVGRDVKYTGDFIDGGGEDCTTDVHIGPGTYTAVRNKSGNHDTILAKADAEADLGRGSHSFDSDLVRKLEAW